MGLDGKLLELEWAVDSWWLLDSHQAVMTEASDKQVQYVTKMLDQLPVKKQLQILQTHKLPTAGGVDLEDALFAMHWKKVSNVIDDLKALVPASAKAQDYLWSLIGKKDPDKAEQAWNMHVSSKDHSLSWPPKETDLATLSAGVVSDMIEALKYAPDASADVAKLTQKQLKQIYDLVDDPALASWNDNDFIDLKKDLKLPPPEVAVQDFTKAQAKVYIAGLQKAVKKAKKDIADKITSKQDSDIFDVESELMDDYGWNATNLVKLKKALNLPGNLTWFTKKEADKYLAGLKKELEAKKGFAAKSGAATAKPSKPIMQWQMNSLMMIIKKKGGADNEKIVKLMNSSSAGMVPSVANDLDALTQDEYKQLYSTIKKMKIKKATNNQVGQVLALLSQLGFANWNASDLSKKWDKKMLKTSELRKLTSPKIKTFIADLKKAVKAA